MATAILEGVKVVDGWPKKYDLLGPNKKLGSTNNKDRQEMIQDWLGSVLPEIDTTELVVIEAQMRRPMDKLTWYITGFLTGIGYAVTVVTPQSVKKQFGTGTGNYRNNKRAAVDFTGINDPDGADAVMLALFANVKYIV